MEFGMHDGWHEQRSGAGGFGIRIGSLVFDRNKRCAGFSVIRRPASLHSSGAQKNGLAVAVAFRWGGTTARSAVYAIFRAVTRGYFWNWRCGGWRAAVVAR